MSLRSRNLLVLFLIAGIFLLANAYAVACWFDRVGLIAWAQRLRDEYLTGTAVTVILAMIFLCGGPRLIGGCARFNRRCPVCDHTLFRSGKYCGACGSRVK